MAGTKICLSPEVVFDFLTGDDSTVQKIKLYSNEDLCITSLTLFEIRSVVEKQEALSEFLNFITILDFDVQAAESAARIIREDLRVSNSRSTKSAINAAICITHNALLFTKDRMSYEGIKGLKLV
jgi:tRNA(fMet)-specific endonuclease VapC